MRLITLTALSLLTLFGNVQAQKSDSLSMLPGNVLDVYYNFNTGTKDTVRNNNWHLAFAVRKALPPLRTMQAATIRINDGRGVELYMAPMGTTWSNFDTTTWSSLPQGSNSDSSWDVGAFNADHNLSNPFDYGWGQYNMTTKDVTGSRIYVIAISSPIPGGPKVLKKLMVQKIAYDTQWVFTFANLNNSDSTTMTIRKSDFSNKLFAYVNLIEKRVIDREPPVGSWDILFTRYKSLVTMFGQTLMYPVMGVFHNPAHQSAEYFGADARVFTPDSSLKLKSSISEIGWDWKIITTTPGVWPVRDSLAYVVKTGQNKYYRLYFTGYFASQQLQYITFNTTFHEILTGVDNIAKENGFIRVFPNPSNGKIAVSFANVYGIKEASMRILDINGKLVDEVQMSNIGEDLTVDRDVTGVKPGIYFVQVLSDKGVLSSKIIID